MNRMRHIEIVGTMPQVYAWGWRPAHGKSWEHFMHVVYQERDKEYVGRFFEYCLN